MQYYFTRAVEKCPVFYYFAETIKSPRIYRGQNGGFGDGKIECYLPQVLQPFVLLFPQELHVPPLHVPQLALLHVPQPLQSVAPATLLITQFEEPKTGPKPQQDFGAAEGENISIGKRIFSKSAQGSPALPTAVQLSGRHLPREFTIMFTVRYSFTMLNRPSVTLTATGAPIAASPQPQPSLQPPLQPQPQPQPQLQGLHVGYLRSAASAIALPSATTNGPPLELPQQS